MWHRNPETYKQYPGQEDVTHGSGILPAITTERGIAWAAPGNQIIYNRKDAEAYAKKLDALINHNRFKHKRRYKI